jgi:hypothetical protein
MTGGRDIAPSEVEEAVAELDNVRSEWLARPGVTGVDVGLRRRGDGLAIRVYVEPKQTREARPPEAAFPERLGRFPVEVIEARFEPQG